MKRRKTLPSTAVRRLLSATLALALPSVACGRDDTERTDRTGGRGLDVRVAPLRLPDIGDVVYGVTVRNGDGDIVWSRNNLSSTRFGDGRGAISYIGPCDAQQNPHTVELQVLSVSTVDGTWLEPGVDYQNPTLDEDGNPWPLGMDGIICVENADVPVVFNLTLMRRAGQGFFDIGVQFDDIFCSAKVDCKDAFLHQNGVRAPTAIVGFACTTGAEAGPPDSPSTVLHYTDLVLTCTDNTSSPPVETTVVIDPTSADEGQQGDRPPLLYQWAAYFGREAFADFDKCYWNLALGLDMGFIGARTCKLALRGTASQGPFAGSGPAPNDIYPYVLWEVTLADDGNLCAEQGLNAPESGVVTAYERPGIPPTAYVARYACGGSPEPVPNVAFACGEEATVDARAAGSAFRVTIDGLSSEQQVLPSGWTLSEDCCATGCCR
jgi:hypothetical protein